MRLSKNLLFSLILSFLSLSAAVSVFHYQGRYKSALLIFPKGSNYDKEWKKVDSLTAKRLTKSALEVVMGIYDKAKAENNAPQFVKAIIHRMKFEQYTEEYSLPKAINKLEDEAKTANYPVKPVLQSMLAESYWRYYQNNRWKFYNRTETANFQNDDITTWDLKTIVDRVIKNYQASLSQGDSLRRTPLNIYDEVLIQRKNTRKYRPTLYDFLAHRAVDFYMNEEPDITKPAYAFEINSESYFWPHSDFAKLQIESKDSMSLKYFAIQTLQDLERFHSGDSKEDKLALIDVDLKRLKFVRSKSVSEIKDSLYLKALSDLAAEYHDLPGVADVNYAIASWYYTKSATYNPLQPDDLDADHSPKWLAKKAQELCDATVKQFPATDGATNCSVLKARITEHNLNFTTEKVVLPGAPFRSLVSFKNLKTVYVRIASMPIDKYNRAVERYYGEALMKQYLSLPVIKEFSVELPDDGDFQTHSTELKMPELPLGHYVVLMGSDKLFSYTKNAVAYGGLWCSSISFVNRRMTDGSVNFFVQNRASGAPLKGVSAQIYYEKYNYTTRRYEYVKSDKYVSDEKGFFNVAPINDYRNFTVDFSYKGSNETTTDRLQTENGIYQYRSYAKDKRKYPVTHFFLDRAIYRPGQTVYFKGILINTDGENNEILANTPTTVTFYDVNYQKVADLDLTTNEYGTVSGSFTAPTGVLNGQMSISNGSGTISFSVEEYKRPKFETVFQPVKGLFRLDETIHASGVAKAYSGARIDGAEVKYRVVRNASFPFWWYCWRGYYPQSAQMEITNGVTTTNDTGAYFIDFKAIPDLSIPKSYQPTYNYTLYADVTDINGETHSTQTSISVAYTALDLNVSLPAAVDRENYKPSAIFTTNKSGEFQSANGSVEIYRLQQPDQTYRERPWSRPDKFLMSKEEFKKNFPLDEYDDENNQFKWERAERVYSYNFKNTSTSVPQKNAGPIIRTSNDSVRIPDLKNWKLGSYVMEAHTTDVYGNDVKDVKYFKVFSNSGSEVSGNEILSFEVLTDGPLEPGDTARAVVGSMEHNVQLLYEVEHKGAIVSREFIPINNEQKIIEFPIEEKHRGGVGYHLLLVKNNRIYSQTWSTAVPYSNKELDLEFETFRDKLLPGQEEQWKIKVKGKNGEKLAAEMMATMYDASLDAFRPNYWNFNIYTNYYANLYWEPSIGFGTVSSQLYAVSWNSYPVGAHRYYDRLNWFGYAYDYSYGADDDYDRLEDGEYGNARYRNTRGYAAAPMGGATETEEMAADEMVLLEKDKSGAKKEDSKNAETKAVAQTGDGTIATTTASNGLISADMPAMYTDGRAESGKDLSNIAARSNFAETAFFYPQLETDKDGNVLIKFTLPESLTKWKVMALAHTKDLKFGTIEKNLVTQKDLMVVPNAPRFFRENDQMEFSAKVTNLTENSMNGVAQIYFYDATTSKDITTLLLSGSASQNFESKGGQSTLLKWGIRIPESIGAISYKVVAKAGNFSDGEEMAIPVLTNRMLVTETLPLPIRGNESKSFRFEKLISQNNGSTTLRNQKLTLEFTSNPAWYAVQSLPYLMEYPYECSEQTFSRFYANSIATHIANSSPKIKAVFDSWKMKSPDALLSNLEKNQELKSLLLEETPWVLDAKDETERKKRVALLFDLNKMSNELGAAMRKLQKVQSSNGGFPWFEGMPDNRYITQYIVTGMGHLDHLGVKNIRTDNASWSMVKNAVRYLDNRIREDYEWILKYDKLHIKDNHLTAIQIQYLYARSYFKDIPVDKRNQAAFDYYFGQEKTYWLESSRYLQGMIGLAQYRYNDKTLANGIIKSLKENSLNNEEMGMYWKENYSGYYWYQAPIEAQALLIEAFDEIASDKKSVDDMKVWLLKSKQTQDWKTTKATAEAVYALLLRGTDWLTTESNVEILVGNEVVDPKKMPDVQQEAGTGYFKTSWSGKEIRPDMGVVKVTKKDDGVSWGALYWQYFEQLDKITPSKTPLNLKKQLFVQRMTATGPVIEPITDKTKLKIGDKVKVRIELRVDRDMEYVQMKDMRAAGFEPTNVISTYKWQDGLGYYESTRDAATNFFFDRLPKGTYVFEYPMFVTHNGDFSNGITSIQCMYAPEFSSNSEGIRVKVGN